jgi:hypothetical protein
MPDGSILGEVISRRHRESRQRPDDSTHVIGPRTYQATDRLTGLKQEFNHSGAQLTSTTNDKDHAIPYPLADASRIAGCEIPKCLPRQQRPRPTVILPPRLSSQPSGIERRTPTGRSASGNATEPAETHHSITS